MEDARPMSTTLQYFGNIRDAVVSTVKGMAITLHYWVKEPSITVEYPDRLGKDITMDDLIAERYRGFLAVNISKCIACMQCMRICPIRCIRVNTEKQETDRFITAFDINQAKCMHCGLCVEVCPTGAILFTKRFEGACFDIRDLCVRHIDVPMKAARVGKDREGN